MKFDFHIPGIGEREMFQTHTPVEALKQRVNFRWYAARRVRRIFVSCVIGSWISQSRRDVKVWQRKIYRWHPPGDTADSPLARMRDWYGQFYSDSFGDPPYEECGRGG